MSISFKKIIDNFVDIKDIDYDKNFSRVARLHKYWSRKPWFIVGEYVRTYSKPEDNILDPFCGSGIIGLEAILEGRNFTGYDLNPFATFLANTTLDVSYNEKELDEDFDHIKKEVSDRIMDLYCVRDGRYILYTILGHKNKKKYNAVVSDPLFKDKTKETLGNKYLNPNIRFPKNTTFPDRDFPKDFYKDRFSYKGVSKVSDMFTKRNLVALSILYNEIQKKNLKNKDLLMLAFTNTLLHVSKLKGENVRPLGVNNFWIPDDYIEENVWWRFTDRLRNIKLAKRAVRERNKNSGISKVGSYKILNKSSLKMREVKANSVDYLITDPPYGDTIQYSELSYIWNCWLEEEFKIKEEVIINPVQKKGFEEYRSQLNSFISEVKRVLKKGGHFTLAFQNKDLKIWIALAEIIRDAGMQLEDISSYSTFGSPYNKNWSKFSPKSDFYVTFKNTKQIKPTRDGGVYPSDIAIDIVKYLGDKNDALFNLNKAYDLFVAAVLVKVFEGYSVYDYEKLNVEKIIDMFKQIVDKDYGDIQTRLFQNI